MSNQEMQFVDPDWEPTRPDQNSTSAQSSSIYTPQPVNDNMRERAQQPAIETPPAREGGYAGYGGYSQIPEQPRQGPYAYQQMPYHRPRRRHRAWVWILLAVLFFSLMGSGASALGSIGEKSVTTNIPISVSTASTPTIVINEPNGNIQVHRGGNLNIQEVKHSGLFDDPNNIQVKVDQPGSTININVETGTSLFSSRSVDFNITVPQDANLQLSTTSGDISVSDTNGAMTLSTVSGNISTINDTFTGNATLSATSGDIHSEGDTFGGDTNVTTVSGDVEMHHEVLNGSAKVNTTSGNIDFDGNIASSSIYHFNTVSGDVRVGLPASSNFTVQADTSSGSIHSESFPSITVRDTNDGSGSHASGSIGSSSGSSIIIGTTSGDITLQNS